MVISCVDLVQNMCENLRCQSWQLPGQRKHKTGNTWRRRRFEWPLPSCYHGNREWMTCVSRAITWRLFSEMKVRPSPWRSWTCPQLGWISRQEARRDEETRKGRCESKACWLKTRSWSFSVCVSFVASYHATVSWLWLIVACHRVNFKFHLSHGAKTLRECGEIYGVKNAISLSKIDAFISCRTSVGGWNAFYVGICFCFPVPAGIPGEVWLRELRCGGTNFQRDFLIPCSSDEPNAAAFSFHQRIL